MSVDWDDLVIGPVVDEFGDPVTYILSTGSIITVTGVFDSEYLDLNAISPEQLGLPGNITAARPVLGVQLSQFTSPPIQGDNLTLASGAAYSVMEVRADGHGWAKLLLNSAS